MAKTQTSFACVSRECFRALERCSLLVPNSLPRLWCVRCQLTFTTRLSSASTLQDSETMLAFFTYERGVTDVLTLRLCSEVTTPCKLPPKSRRNTNASVQTQ